MAHLNCPTCCHQSMFFDQWGAPCDPQCVGSNMSLNMPYPVNPMFMGTWHGPPPSMYPCPVPHMMQSRPQSRAASPTHSVKSRKSLMSKKSSRRKYRETEDSEDDDRDERRSVRSERKPANTRFIERKIPLRDAVSVPRDFSRRGTFDRSSVSRSRHSVRVSSSESDDELESESQKESEILEEEDDDEPLGKRKQARETSSAPGSTWECEHCTFVNEAGTRVCSICCKTSTSAEGRIVKSNGRKGDLSVPNKLNEKKSRSSDDYSKDYSETESLQNKMGKIKVADEKGKKGRTIRKISFWPGTKFAAFQK